MKDCEGETFDANNLPYELSGSSRGKNGDVSIFKAFCHFLLMEGKVGFSPMKCIEMYSQ